VQGFSLLLHHFKIKPVASIEALGQVDPRETILIVFGDPAPLSRMPWSVGEFVEKGGAVLVASDRPTGQLLRDFEVEVAGDIVHQNLVKTAYKELKDCPIVTPADREHPLFDRVNRLATINPSQLVPQGRILYLSKLALFPNGCVSNKLGAPRGSPFIMGSDAASKHRVLVIGGHSVFMNVLMAQGELDNFTFAVNAIRWLGQQGRRKQCLFVIDGSVAENYNVPLGGIPVPTVKLVNQFLHRMEQERLFDRIAQAFFPRSLVLSGLYLGTTLFLAIYIFWRVWAKRHEIPREAPLLSAKVAQNVPNKTVMAFRQQALLDEDNLWDVARSLARQCFERRGHGGQCRPVVRAHGVARKRRECQRSVLALWKLAFGPPRRRIRARDFSRVLKDIEAVDEWLDNGIVHLERPLPPDGPRPGGLSPRALPN
jgi:hypothetical protein